jgi:outer membrane protein OmpA-like peptidoglycan-associated protein
VQRDLEGCAIQHVRIVGLAGARGDETDNLNVSMARAEAIAAALEQGGWPADHFELIALGEHDATTAEGVGRPMRRRAHISVRAAPTS